MLSGGSRRGGGSLTFCPGPASFSTDYLYYCDGRHNVRPSPYSALGGPAPLSVLARTATGDAYNKHYTSPCTFTLPYVWKPLQV